MDLTSPKTIKELLEKHGAKPSKGLGQNFLIDRNILNKIIDSANIKPSDTILEVGPGMGTLTQELAKKAGKVIAVEKDKAMLKILQDTLSEFKNVSIINDDILSTDISALFSVIPAKAGIQSEHTDSGLPRRSAPRNDVHYKLVANIPYYLTSPLIRKFLEIDNPPEEIILMIQKEVAQRICAKPNDMSLLAVSVQFYADPKIISYVSKNCFLPAPKIDSAIIKITPRLAEALAKAGPDFPNKFFKVVKAGFSQPRKQLAGNLSRTLKMDKEKVFHWLAQNNIDPKQRAETLSVQDWKNLTNSL
jgi:16S rRNA (adenine1518-N6/adenine1519-N6)-dimethyltransferase